MILTTRSTAGCCALALVLGLVTGGNAAAAGYLKLPDIGGDARVAGSDGWIELNSVSPKPRAGMSSIDLVKPIDKTSRSLREAHDKKRTFPNALVLVPSVKGYAKYKLNRCFVKSWSTNGLTERVTLGFKSLERQDDWEVPRAAVPKPDRGGPVQLKSPAAPSDATQDGSAKDPAFMTLKFQPGPTVLLPAGHTAGLTANGHTVRGITRISTSPRREGGGWVTVERPASKEGFVQWIRKAGFGPIGSASVPRNGSIVHHDSHLTPVKRYVFENAWAVKVDRSAAGEVAIERFTLSVERIEPN